MPLTGTLRFDVGKAVATTRSPLRSRKIGLMQWVVRDAKGGVALLAVNLPVLPEDLLDDRRECSDPPLLTRLTLPIAGRLGVFQNFFQRVSVNAKLLAHASPASPLHKHPSSNLGPLFHVRKHP